MSAQNHVPTTNNGQNKPWARGMHEKLRCPEYLVNISQINHPTITQTIHSTILPLH